MNADFIYNPPLFPFLDVLYEDDDIMVVNKPSGLLSVPGRLKEHHDSILSRIKSSYPDAFAVHRLDMGTSGVLVVGLNKNDVSNLGKQFMGREVKKIYIAIVDGIIEKSGSVDLPLILDINNRPYQKVDFEVGKPALTFYEPLCNDGKTTLVRLFPLTGRSHQLRVHLKEIGHPILGDHLYAPPEIRDASPHLYLHAGCLSFCHPMSGKRMDFCAPPPFDVPSEFMPDKSWFALIPEAKKEIGR